MKMFRPSPIQGTARAALFAFVTFLAIPVATFAQIFVSIPGDNDAFNGVIKNYASDGSSVTLASGLSVPEGIAFWGTDLYVSLNTSHGAYATIVKFAPNGSSTVFSSATGFQSTLGLAFDAAGNLYAAGNTGIMKFTPTGGGTPIPFATTTSVAYGLAIDSSGNVYTSLRDTDTIVSFNSSGIQNWSVSAGDAPVGLAVNGTTLFVANHADNSIDLYSTVDGSSLGNYATSVDGLTGAFGLAFSGGKLYVANDGGATGSIGIFTAAHTGTSFATSSFPAFIAASAVPEPSTYAVLAGLGALGFAAWRRRRAA